MFIFKYIGLSWVIKVKWCELALAEPFVDLNFQNFPTMQPRSNSLIVLIEQYLDIYLSIKIVPKWFE